VRCLPALALILAVKLSFVSKALRSLCKRFAIVSGPQCARLLLSKAIFFYVYLLIMHRASSYVDEHAGLQLGLDDLATVWHCNVDGKNIPGRWICLKSVIFGVIGQPCCCHFEFPMCAHIPHVGYYVEVRQFHYLVRGCHDETAQQAQLVDMFYIQPKAWGTELSLGEPET